MLVFFSRIPLDDVPGSCQPFLFEFRVDDAYLDWRVCTVCTLDQSCAGQRHVVYHAGYRLSACGGICSVGNRHRYQHRPRAAEKPSDKRRAAMTTDLPSFGTGGCPSDLRSL